MAKNKGGKTPASDGSVSKKHGASSESTEKITVAIAPGVRTLLKAYLERENAKPAHARKPLSRSSVLTRALAEFLRAVRLPASPE